MSLHPRALPAGFVAPCLPSSQSPSGEEWLHEIKHDGFRVIARKDGASVRLHSRPGNDLTKRFPPIVEGLVQLHLWSCIIDGEAVACGEDGIASFDRIRYRQHDASVFLFKSASIAVVQFCAGISPSAAINGPLPSGGSSQ
jgi:bifunctional non-homologous end joining protein LigD